MSKKKTDSTVTKTLKSIYDEADHILGTLRDAKKEKTIGTMKAQMNIVRDDAMAIQQFALTIINKKSIKEED
jgi:hypothetical protein